MTISKITISHPGCWLSQLCMKKGFRNEIKANEGLANRRMPRFAAGYHLFLQLAGPLFHPYAAAGRHCGALPATPANASAMVRAGASLNLPIR
jgi:hypothetical protein